MSKRKIIFVATREPSYSRVAITQKQLQATFDVQSIVSSKKSYLVRMLSITCQLVAAWLTGKLRRSDAVFVGFLAQPILPVVKLLHRGPIVSDAYFSLYDAMVNDKQKVSPKSWTAKVCFWLDQFMLKHSTLCFTDTRQHVDYMRSFFEVPNADLRRLWISAESKPVNCPTYSNGTFEVFFWGGFIPLQGVDTIVRTAAILDDENVCVTIFGTGQTFNTCQKLAQQLNATNVNFAGWQLPANIVAQAQRSHLALGIFGTTEKASRVIPNKVYEAMAMGIPLVTMRSPAANELLIDAKHCLMVDAGSPEQLAEAIRHAKNNPHKLSQMATASQTLFRECCSPEVVGQTMRAAIEEICKPSRALPQTKSYSFRGLIQRLKPQKKMGPG